MAHHPIVCYMNCVLLNKAPSLANTTLVEMVLLLRKTSTNKIESTMEAVSVIIYSPKDNPNEALYIEKV